MLVVIVLCFRKMPFSPCAKYPASSRWPLFQLCRALRRRRRRICAMHRWNSDQQHQFFCWPRHKRHFFDFQGCLSTKALIKFDWHMLRQEDHCHMQVSTHSWLVSGSVCRWHFAFLPPFIWSHSQNARSLEAFLGFEHLSYNPPRRTLQPSPAPSRLQPLSPQQLPFWGSIRAPSNRWWTTTSSPGEPSPPGHSLGKVSSVRKPKDKWCIESYRI